MCPGGKLSVCALKEPADRVHPLLARSVRTVVDVLKVACRREVSEVELHLVEPFLCDFFGYADVIVPNRVLYGFAQRVPLLDSQACPGVLMLCSAHSGLAPVKAWSQNTGKRAIV